MRNVCDMPLDGGCLCFDFVNTVPNRKAEVQEDYLHSYADLLSWCVHTGLLSEDASEELLNRTSVTSRKKLFATALELRENLYRIFSAVASGTAPPEKEFQSFNRHLQHSLRTVVLAGTGDQKEIIWSDHTEGAFPLHQVMASAFGLWTGQESRRIKECERCGWLFLDTTKNNSRRWCSMNSCGSSDKALRYYYRQKKKGPGNP